MTPSVIPPETTIPPVAESPFCIVCREPIKIGALKCTHCDSYQDWRRFLTIGSATLALAISCFSLLTSSGPAIRDFILSKQEDITVSVANPTPREVKVVAFNSGRGPGLLQPAATFLLTRSDGSLVKEFVHFYQGNDKSEDAIIVKGGETTVFRVVQELFGNVPFGKDAIFAKCEIEYVVRRLPNGSRTAKASLPCPSH
jgi:hypothetical protein